MNYKESQEEECEVLRAIYEGDERFKEISPTVFQYKIGDESDAKTFLVEVSWSENYPDELPIISLNAFYNKLVAPAVRSHIISTLASQADSLRGAAMTYTLFEYAKENAEDLMANQSQLQMPSSDGVDAESSSSMTCSVAAKAKERKEQLTKAQKRKMTGRQDEKGEMARGWNWVDVVKHLCQTGRAADADS
jgi:hypothetical protein